MQGISENVKWLGFIERVIPGEDCWLWTLAPQNGYSTWNVDNTKILAHRASYEFIHGEIPEEKEIDHLCRNRACVNPEHLEAVSHRENILRAPGVMAENHAKEECVNGHPYSIQNTYQRRRAGRYPERDCYTCRTVRNINRFSRIPINPGNATLIE